MKYILRCGDGESIGCNATTTVDKIGESKDGFVYEHFNGGFYICPNSCTDSNVDVLDEQGNEIPESIRGNCLNELNEDGPGEYGLVDTERSN